jgi:hypothetical protein
MLQLKNGTQSTKNGTQSTKFVHLIKMCEIYHQETCSNADWVEKIPFFKRNNLKKCVQGRQKNHEYESCQQISQSNSRGGNYD